MPCASTESYLGGPLGLTSAVGAWSITRIVDLGREDG